MKVRRFCHQAYNSKVEIILEQRYILMLRSYHPAKFEKNLNFKGTQ